ncbi:MAG: YggT family protein [Thermaerobacterales bacterium]
MSWFLVNMISTLFDILFWLILIRALSSWFRPRTDSKLYVDIQNVLHVITEPILAPIRRLVPPERLGLDVSPFIAMIALNFIGQTLVRILFQVL